MNITIIEDELEILNGIRSSLEDERKWRVHAYDNAEEALVGIKRIRPEIIITDIVLPKLSGLDLIVQCKANEYQPKIVVISSYSSFEYAQRSLKLGAIDYLLKPIDVQELAGKIDSLAELVRREARHSLQSRDQSRMTQMGIAFLREKFMLGLCMKKTPLQELIYHRLQMWGLTWLCEKSFVALLFDCKEPLQPLSERELDLRNFAVHNIVAETLEGFRDTVLLKNVLQQWVIITADDEQAVLRSITRSLAQYQRMKPVIGISDRMHAFESISQAYEQAAQAFRQAGMLREQTWCYYCDLQADSAFDDRLAGQVAVMAEAIRDGDAEAIDRGVKTVVRAFALAEECLGWKEVVHSCFAWLIDLHAELSAMLSKNFNHAPVELWKSIDACQFLTDLEVTISGHLQDIAASVSSSGHHFIIERTKKMLEERFGEEVIQQKIAEELQIHPVWLSQLFKKETGRNFLDYLTEVRMEKGKALLRDSNYKIYEIANIVGYQDIQYFGKLFKKWTGVTPKEYRYGK